MEVGVQCSGVAESDGGGGDFDESTSVTVHWDVGSRTRALGDLVTELGPRPTTSQGLRRHRRHEAEE
jgi:hypothetical protein